MNILSLEFLLFALLIVVLFYAVPKRWRWIVILFGNVIFYAFADLRYIGYLIIATLSTFFGAIYINKVSIRYKEMLQATEDAEEKKKIKTSAMRIKKTICLLSIIIPMGIWVVLKYTNFFLENINDLFSMLRINTKINSVSWMLPLGISFYTFHAVGYLVDVYRNKYVPENNYLKYFAFVSYFPHIIQGPFSRFDELGKSISSDHSFSYDRLCRGCARMLWGFFKKIVIADKIGIAATSIFADSYTYSGIYMIFAMCAYGIQLYADFSGYMDIMCGFSSIIGIDLAENFERPYFAKTVDEFWRRWHITLGTWFRDYVFYPVSMGKLGQKMGKKARKKWGPKMGKLVPGYFALIFVWTATGLWHGANWTYLVWGYLNLFVIASTMQLAEFYEKLKNILHIKSDSFLWKLFCIVRTFVLVCFFRFFSAAPDINTALAMLKNALLLNNINILSRPSALFVGVSYIDIYFCVCGVIILIVIDLLEEIGMWARVKQVHPIVRDIAYTFMIVLIVLSYGSGSNLMGGFMYASF